jgi:cytochrome c553
MKMRKLAIIVLSSLLSVSAMSAVAADAVAGKAKSGMCAACHGADGVSFVPMYPNLKGQKAAYMEKQLRAFKDGSRKDPVMGPMAMPLNDDDIANISAYYAEMK